MAKKNQINVAAETVNFFAEAKIPSALEIYMAKQQKAEEAKAANVTAAATALDAHKALLEKIDAEMEHLSTMKAAIAEFYANLLPETVAGITLTLDDTLGTPAVDAPTQSFKIVDRRVTSPDYQPREIAVPAVKKYTRAKAMSQPSDDFEPIATKTVKATAKTRDDHKAGKNAFKELFRDTIIAALKTLKPGYQTTVRTVSEDAPEEARKFNVNITVGNLGSTVSIERHSKNPRKAFTVEIPKTGNTIDRNLIPVFAPKQ
jgi:hypothetical protein